MTQLGHVLGPVPEWLTLGPLQEHLGLEAREVIGDWSHLNECDRPPKFLVDDIEVHNRVSGWDKSETRTPIRQLHPGKHISELKGKHSGKVAILFNGGSMKALDLHKIKVPIIGMNRTHQGYEGYNGPQPDYLCIIDWVWFNLKSYRKSVLKHPCIINGSDHKAEIGYRVQRHPRMAPFSFDLERDGYVGPIPASTGHLALQLAVWLGFTEIHCIGWDLGGKHFDGTSASRFFVDAIRYHSRQAPLLKEKDVNVYVCASPDSRVKGFEHSSFEAVC